MKNQNDLLDAVVEVAMEMELTDPTDFGMNRISEETAYRFIASQIIDDMSQLESDTERYLVALSTATHLLVENFILHQKFMSYLKQNS